MSDDTGPVLYLETQKFRQPWLWILLGGLALLEIGVFGWGLYQQVVLHQPFGKNPMSDRALILLTAGIVGFMVLLLALFWFMGLTTRVTPRQVQLRFLPFRNRRIPLEEIAGWEPRTYRPVRDYGGWGIKYGGRGEWIYNVSGNRGVRLWFVTGKSLMVGSQDPDAFAAALREATGREPRIPAGD